MAQENRRCAACANVRVWRDIFGPQFPLAVTSFPSPSNSQYGACITLLAKVLCQVETNVKGKQVQW
jgi:hypothetical protein